MITNGVNARPQSIDTALARPSPASSPRFLTAESIPTAARLDTIRKGPDAMFLWASTTAPPHGSTSPHQNISHNAGQRARKQNFLLGTKDGRCALNNLQPSFVLWQAVTTTLHAPLVGVCRTKAVGT